MYMTGNEYFDNDAGRLVQEWWWKPINQEKTIH